MDVIGVLSSEIQNGKIIKLDKKNKEEPPRSKPVSYTHLDVYKRQLLFSGSS